MPAYTFRVKLKSKDFDILFEIEYLIELLLPLSHALCMFLFVVLVKCHACSC